MGRKWHNPVAFTPLPVTVITTLVYCAVLVCLLIAHERVPPAPATASPISGINITEAWLDLKVLSNGFHPYNSRRNDVVRNWLLQRIDDILTENNASYTTKTGRTPGAYKQPDTDVVVFNDLTSNLTFSTNLFGSPGVSTYFEGTNIIVYIRGTEDQHFGWHASNRSKTGGGVLVNAHYDSVSTGYGATDDGVGVVSILQLIRFFSHSGRKPRRGIVALLNNGEEDYLNGARAFARHPISSFAHTFVNLEGAGAGGKATLFRATDTEVTRFYKGTSHPYGSVVSQDGFQRGLIQSETDFVVFHNNLGMRGLDIAFFEPRARYHTEQDDTKHTSRDSLWHMLSAVLHSVNGLSMDASFTFEGASSGKGKVKSGIGSDDVYFDIFGRAFAVFELHTLFTLSVTLLVVAPIAFIAVGGVLSRVDRLYLFSVSKSRHADSIDHKIQLGGLRGCFRYPIVFAIASAATVGSAFLLAKQNPHIAYSSPYAVWAMMVSIWFCLAWVSTRAVDFIRPSAFHRLFALLWMSLGGWVLLLITTILEESMHIGSGYLPMFYFTAISVSTLIAISEQFGLETKEAFVLEQEHVSESIPSQAERTEDDRREHNDEESTESSALLGPHNRRTTFANYSSSGRPDSQDAERTMEDEAEKKHGLVFGNEQKWSRSLPSWTWLLQLLILVPIPLIMMGQVGLQTAVAMNQTSADGASTLIVYMIMAGFSILVLAPLGPFLHRYTYHVPLFLFAVLVGTLIYNLVAFPFSGTNRLKVYFRQHIDLDTGINRVALTSIGSPYIEQILETLPSAAGKTPIIGWSGRGGLVEYSWHGIPPEVVPSVSPDVPPSIGYRDWLDFTAERYPRSSKATMAVSGKNTRACVIRFNKPVSNIAIDGSATDNRFPVAQEEGSWEIRLWSREWHKTWNVTFEWEGDEGMDGRVICTWEDEDGLRSIPALEEVRRFSPDWVAITKFLGGLVEGSKAFAV